MANNGLKSFSLHASRASDDNAVRSLERERPARRFGIAAAEGAELDPETAARRHLMQAIKSDSVPEFSMPEVEAATGEFRALGTESLPFLGTKTVKFRQAYNKIPVYGSLVTVELGEA